MMEGHLKLRSELKMFEENNDYKHIFLGFS